MTAADIVSNAKIVMTAIVFMETASLPIVAENVRAWRIFWTNQGNNRGASPLPRSYARSGPSLRTVASPTHFSPTLPDPNWQSSNSAVGRWHDGASRSKSSIPVVERGTRSPSSQAAE